MRTSIGLVAAVLLLLAGCGGDDSAGRQLDPTAPELEGGLELDLEAISPDDGGPGVDWDGEVLFEVDFDDLQDAIGEFFQGADVGRGSSVWGTWIEIDVEVRPDELSDEQLVEACAGLSEWLFEQPPELASGPIVVTVSERDLDGDADPVALLNNDTLIAGEQVGTCQPT